MSNSGFLLTDLGLQDASVANPSGPYFHIASFQVANGVNYTPNRSQTALQGITSYTGVPQSYTIVDNDTVDVVLVMDASVGPFSFGEIGIYSSDSTLLAVCVFDTLQEKVRAVGNQAGNIWRIHARMKLAQAPAICEIEVSNPMTILEVGSWPELAAPVNQLNGANAAIVHEKNTNDDSILVMRESDTEWDLVAYRLTFTGNTTDSGATATTTTLNHPNLAAVFMTLPSTNSRYVAKFSDGSIRKIVSQTSTSNITWTPTLGTVPTGKITVWEDATVAPLLAVVGAYEFNMLAVNFNRFWAAPTGNYPTDNAGVGQTAIPAVTTQATGPQWNHMADCIRRFMMLTNITTPVAPSDIVDTDFVVNPSNPSVPGMATMIDRYSKYTGAVALMDAHRNTFDPTMQETVTLPGAHKQRTTAFLASVTYNLSLDFAGNVKRRVFSNSGCNVIITSNASQTSTFYTEWYTLLHAIGSVVIKAGTTASSNAFGTGSAFGLANCSTTMTPTLLYTASRFSSPLATSITYNVYGRRDTVTGFVYLEVEEKLDSGSGYSYATSGLMTQDVNIVRPTASVLFDPAVALPTALVTGTF